jgi:SAM-dependent methyltransferase
LRLPAPSGEVVVAGRMKAREILALNQAHYGRHVAVYARLAAERDLTRVYDLVEMALPPGARLLDIGCGTGDDARVFLDRGFRVTAIDASPAMVRHCRRRGIPARRGNFQSLAFVRTFDAVWAAASLLHVPRAEMSAVLRRLGRALRPEGLIYVSLWHGRSERVTPDGRFVAGYSRTGFARLLRAAGIDVLRSWGSASPPPAKVKWVHFIGCRRKSPTTGKRRRA